MGILKTNKQLYIAGNGNFKKYIWIPDSVWYSQEAPWYVHSLPREKDIQWIHLAISINCLREHFGSCLLCRIISIIVDSRPWASHDEQWNGPKCIDEDDAEVII